MNKDETLGNVKARNRAEEEAKTEYLARQTIEQMKKYDCVKDDDGNILSIFTIEKGERGKPYWSGMFVNEDAFEWFDVYHWLLRNGIPLARVTLPPDNGFYYGHPGDQGTILSNLANGNHSRELNEVQTYLDLQYAGVLPDCLPIMERSLKPELSGISAMELIQAKLRRLNDFYEEIGIPRQLHFAEADLANYAHLLGE